MFAFFFVVILPVVRLFPRFKLEEHACCGENGRDNPEHHVQIEVLEEICHADRCEGAADGGDQDYGNAFERNADQADHESNEGDESITCDIVWIDEMPEAKADEPADQKKKSDPVEDEGNDCGQKTGADGKSDTRSLASEDEIFTVDLEKAKELFAQPKYGRGRGRGAAKPPLRDLGTDPETQKHVTIKDGFYGAYITDGETNRTLPKQYAPESIEPAEAFRLLAEKRAQGPSKRRGRKTAAKGAKKGAAKGAKSAKKVSATEQARADRRAKVRELADKGWANTRIAKEIGSTASTVKADVDWLTANEGYARPEVVPAR